MSKQYHTVYKITTTFNEKYYIGVHSTDNVNDGYMGSGTLLIKAINKHGILHFRKEILHTFDTREEALKKESVIVNQKLVMDKLCYNMVAGGGGTTILEERESIGKTKFEKYDANVKYIFTKNETGLYKYEAQLIRLPESIIRKVSYMFIEGIDSTCELLTNCYNNKFDNKVASSLIREFAIQNLMTCIDVKESKW